MERGGEQRDGEQRDGSVVHFVNFGTVPLFTVPLFTPLFTLSCLTKKSSAVISQRIMKWDQQGSNL